MPTIGVRVTQEQYDTIKVYARTTHTTITDILRTFITGLMHEVTDDFDYDWQISLCNITDLRIEQIRYYLQHSYGPADFFASVSGKAKKLTFHVEYTADETILQVKDATNFFIVKSPNGLSKLATIQKLSLDIERSILGEFNDSVSD